MTFKVLIVLIVFLIVISPLLKHSWKDIARRINLALIAALIAVLLFRVIVWIREP